MPSELTTGQAVALGVLHGPAELLPVSSSAHVALVPRLLGWEYARLPGDVRKSFEVALHTGTLAGLLLITPRPSARLALLATAPAAVVGLAFEDPIEQRLGGPRATAAGLLAGAAILVAADAHGDGRRRPGLALALGLAQATALVPGLSRLGMSVAAARLMGLPRREAFLVGRQVGLPVVAGATALKGFRIARGGLPR
ncbi:MAG: undecaprenyl-diphosphate phosphatase, partial [Solirubrobacterales bacterium]|nr:undecaprenyl-diphosphate phosphatase [Solirubrobacterales bacterium]